MNKKLTLLLDEQIISRAKDYANRNRQSLSRMVEKYFIYLTGRGSSLKNGAEIPKEIEEIVGIVNVPDTLDVKAEYRRCRAQKGMHD